MSITQNDIARLEQALVDLATGDRPIEVQHSDGTQVRYAGVSAVQAALSTARSSRAQQQGRPWMTRTRTGKGL